MRLLAAATITFTSADDPVTALLSTDHLLVPCDSMGMPRIALGSSPLTSRMTIIQGGAEQSGWSFSRTQQGVVSSVDSSGVVSVTAISADNGYVEVTAFKTGQSSLVKKLTVSKVYQGDTGETGPQGPMGNPGAVGVNTDGNKIQVAGFDDEGAFGASTGIIYNGSSRIEISFTEYTCTADGEGYIVLVNNSVAFAKLTTAVIGTGENISYRMIWVDFNDPSEEIAPNLVAGRFIVSFGSVTEAEMIQPAQPEAFLKSNLMQVLLEASSAGDAKLKTTAMAMGADRVFQTLVAIEAFIRDLYVHNIESEGFSTDAQGFPNLGYKLGRDPVTGEVVAKIANLYAKNANISGNFFNEGFKTLDPFAGTTVTTYTTPKTIYKYSEAFALIPDADMLQSLSGTFEGFSFSQATRRASRRILLDNHTSPTSVNVSAGNWYILKRSVPTQMFGQSFYVEWHFSYNGNMGARNLFRTKAGDSVSTIRNDFHASKTVDDEYIYLYRDDMTLWQSGKGSGTYSGTYSLNSTRNEITVVPRSSALWGTETATCNYLRVYTSKTFNSVVLATASDYREIPDQPNAYYLSSLKTFNIGGTTQDSSTMKKYVSGTDFYNRFSSIPVGAIGDVTGAISYNGAPYPVNRLQKTANSIIFWSGAIQIVVNKFQNGTNIGAYTDLKITSNIVFGKIDGGIETMHILPFDGAHNTYDLGQNAKRFRSGYFNSLVTNGLSSNGNIGVTGNVAASNELSAAKMSIGGRESFSCRAWVNFNGTGTVAVRASQNVSSISDLGTGYYRINFSTPMPDANYAFFGSGNTDRNNYDNLLSQIITISSHVLTTSLTFQWKVVAGGGGLGSRDTTVITVAVVR